MRFDRAYQKEILGRLIQDYPDISDENRAWFDNEINNNGDTYACNVSYLQDHGLLNSGVDVSKDFSGIPCQITLSFPSITAKGIDFTAQDGGLNAILSVQTVKLHNDTIRDLLSVAVQSSKASEEEKAHLLKVIKEVPAEGLKHLLTELIDFALSSAPLTEIFQNIDS